jgi:hypothetical protein
MNKKITRRVAVGTLIGGLAVTPLVVSALRKKHNVPETDFDKQWKQHRNLMLLKDYRLNSIEQKQAEVVMAYDVDKTMKMSVMTVISLSGDYNNYESTEGSPDIFTFLHGQVGLGQIHDAEAYNGKPFVKGNIKEAKMYSRIKSPMILAEQEPFSFMFDGLECFPMETNGTTKIFSNKDLPQKLAGVVATVFPIGVPLNTKLENWLGGEWSNNFLIKIPCSLVGTGTIKGLPVFVINGQRQMDAKELQNHLKTKITSDIDANLKKYFEMKLFESQRDLRGISISLKQYIHQKNGVVLRNEAINVFSVPEVNGFGSTQIITNFDYS